MKTKIGEKTQRKTDERFNCYLEDIDETAKLCGFANK
jgi:hypothetical protein